MISWTGLLQRTLWYHSAANIAIALGCFIGTAVLTGALLVGDSMRGSLRHMTLQRLGAGTAAGAVAEQLSPAARATGIAGGIDLALVSNTFFPTDLAQRLAQQPTFDQHFAAVTPIILIQGAVEGVPANSAANAATGERRRANQVQIIGVNEGFWNLFPKQTASANHGNGGAGTGVVINAELATELKVQVGDTLLVQVEKASAVPRESLLGRRDETLRAIRLTITDILPMSGAGRFHLATTQRLPLNLYIPSEQLASELGQANEGNALLLTAQQPAASREVGEQQAELAQQLLKASLQLEDYQLQWRGNPEANYVNIESDRLILSNPVVSAIEQVAAKHQWQLQKISSYLVNSIQHKEKSVPYSLMVAMEYPLTAPLGPLPVEFKPSAPTEPLPAERVPKIGDVFLNRWTADALQAKVGDQIQLEFFQVQEGERLVTQIVTRTVAGVVPMQGLAIDPHYAPEYPGITNARRARDWNPPFPFDNRKVGSADEKYWEEYRTAPKVFLPLADGLDLWATRFGKFSSVRLAVPPGLTYEAFAAQLRRELTLELTPGSAGLVFQPVKSQDLYASRGSTDFDQLFLAFSFFLIISAGLLVGLLFRLNTERRSQQIGLLLAIGWTVSQVRWLLLGEGLCLAVLGGLLGIVGAIGYAQLMIAGLTSQWRAAVNVPFIELHWTITSLAIGLVLSVLLAMLAIAWAVWQLGQAQVPSLMSPGFTFAAGQRRTTGFRLSAILAVLSLVGGLALIAAATVLEPALAFFVGGFCLLVGSLASLSTILRRPQQGLIVVAQSAPITRLGVRNAGRYPARSVLTAGLLAFAVFLLVAIGALRTGAEVEDDSPSGPSGGFTHVAAATVPLFQDLQSEQGALDLGFSPELTVALQKPAVQMIGCRRRLGDDASCLNVYKPRAPTILGVPNKWIERGGFSFASTIALTPQERENPWRLLRRTFPDGAVPVLGDAETLQWILKLGLGDTLMVRDEAGRPVPLRVVGALQGGLFQGELLAAEDRFIELYPSIGGRSFYLLDLPADQQQLVAELETELGDWGFDVTTTTQRLANYHAVKNTYMAAFQTLGGLGLLLGTMGLGTVLLRNVWERQGELALLRALGYSQFHLSWLVLAENTFLLLAGVILGTVSALLAVSPVLWQSPHWEPLWSVAGLLLAVLALGTASSVLALRAVWRTPLLTALRAG